MKPRKSFLKRSAIKRKHRKPSEFKRIYGSKERVEWVKEQKCICATTMCEPCWIENAHIKTGGTGRKADADQIVPLCRFHHQMLHDKGVNWFENTYGIELSTEASRVCKLWEEHEQI